MLEKLKPLWTNARVLRNQVGALSYWLTKPLVPMASFEDRLKSQWVTSVLLFLFPVGTVLACYPNVIPPWPELAVPLMLLICFIPFYLLSRLGQHKTIAMLSILIALVAIWTAAIVDKGLTKQVFDTVMLVMPILFASTVLSQRATFIVVGIAFLSLLSLPLFVPQLSYLDILCGPLNVLVIKLPWSHSALSYVSELRQIT